MTYWRWNNLLTEQADTDRVPSATMVVHRSRGIDALAAFKRRRDMAGPPARADALLRRF